MGNYSIKELEQLSGIKAHTIRIWEKRHKLIAPRRTKTNIRYYSDADLKKIIGISVLNNHGVKISKIAALSSDQINKQIEEISESGDHFEVHIDQLVLSMIDLDEDLFEKLMAGLILKYSFERTILEIIYPFLEKIGILWLTNNITPAQEHFISNLIRQKIIVAIDALVIAPKTAARAILFLPENELHELGLLFFHYLMRRRGWRTYYLGQSVPFENLKQVIREHKPHFLVTSITSPLPGPEMKEFVKKLAKEFPSTKIALSGLALKSSAIKFPPNFFLVENALKFKELLENQP